MVQRVLRAAMLDALRFDRDEGAAPPIEGSPPNRATPIEGT
jgi:hypothetical protein